MKRFFILFLVLCALNNIAIAQFDGFKYGARFGIGRATINEAAIGDQTGKLALSGGITSAYYFNKTFGLQADFLFTSKGSRASGQEVVQGFFGSTTFNYEETYRMYYLEVPVTGRVAFGTDNFLVRFYGGPSLNFNLLGTQTRIYEDPDYNEDQGFYDRRIAGLELVEGAGVFGTGFEVAGDEGIFFLDIRNVMAFTPFGRVNGQDAYNNYFVVGVGYLY